MLPHRKHQVRGWVMFEKLSDKTIKTLVIGGRTIKGIGPFLRHPRDMIALREEGYRRGFAVTGDDVGGELSKTFAELTRK